MMFKQKIKITATGLVLMFMSYSLAVKSQVMGDAERKSMEKGAIYPSLKGGGEGVSGPGSNLSAEKMKWWEDQKFGMFIHWVYMQSRQVGMDHV
ncbi:hypothetical protein H9N25_05200 [Pedobacter riviphilus]|uniref:Uncharacterized protein n=1 Tax=Pedobacter riviphilus TaxID=2766984 RepID=A0ABX6TK57_9SPHI|nr:hypothetical protein [Pedobacter riviphilus]QNR85853.1 hypothetical protein H9N25_05200 [Pedobacter riviphilus]